MTPPKSEDLTAFLADQLKRDEALKSSIDEIRIARADTEQNLAELSELVKELVQAFKGNQFGSTGILTRISVIEADIAVIKSAQGNAQGMKILIGWGVAALGVAVAVKTLTGK